jgi:hypothetical protein
MKLSGTGVLIVFGFGVVGSPGEGVGGDIFFSTLLFSTLLFSRG